MLPGPYLLNFHPFTDFPRKGMGEHFGQGVNITEREPRSAAFAM
jgi:hypothetical protein